MKCDLCEEREAVLFIEEPLSGKRMKMCVNCAAGYGLDLEDISSLNKENMGEIFSRLLSKLREKMKEKDAASSRKCRVCSTSLSDIKKNLKVGCAACFDEFEDEMEKLLKGHGIIGVYKTDSPLHTENSEDMLFRRALLRDRLIQAVKEEDYESAAVYRDYLKEIDAGEGKE